jgi:hypothetical protein
MSGFFIRSGVGGLLHLNYYLDDPMAGLFGKPLLGN